MPIHKSEKGSLGCLVSALFGVQVGAGQTPLRQRAFDFHRSDRPDAPHQT